MIRKYGLLLRLGGVTAIAFLLSRVVDFGAAMENISRASLPAVVVALVLVYVSVPLRAWRWQQIGLTCNLDCGSFSNYLRLLFAGMFAGTVVPSGLAALVPAAFIGRDGATLRLAAFTIVVDRLAELILLLVFAAAACIYVLPWIPEMRYLIFAGAAAATGFTGLFFLLRSDFPLVGRMVPALKTRFTAAVPDARISAAVAAKITVVSIAILLLQVLSALALAVSLDLDVSLVYLAAVISIVSLVASLPIAPLGLGTREGLLVALLAPVGVSAESALALGVLIFLVTLLPRLSGAVTWFTLPRVPPQLESAEAA